MPVMDVGEMPVIVYSFFVYMVVGMWFIRRCRIFFMGMVMVFIIMNMGVTVCKSLVAVQVPVFFMKQQPRAGYHKWK